jgi:hypothetical protein
MGDEQVARGRWDRWLYLASGVLLAAVAAVVVVLEPGEPDAVGPPIPVSMGSAPGEWGSHPWIGETPGLDGSGYVGYLDGPESGLESGPSSGPESGSVTLLWHGPADAVQRRILERARGSGIPMRVEQRRYGRQQLEQAGRAILGSSDAGVFAGFWISGVEAVSARFDGVVVVGELVREPEGTPAEAEAALGAAAAAEFGVAVDVEIVMLLVPAGG